MDNPIRRSAAPISDADLAMVEHRLGLTLPADYRQYLLEHNGGVPKRTEFVYTNRKGQQRRCWVKYFYPVGPAARIDVDWTELDAGWSDRPSGLPASVLPVADAHYEGNDGFVCVGCDGELTGKVYFRPDTDPEKTVLYPVADSFGAFLAGLAYEGKPNAWKEALEAGDAPAFRAWLETKHEKLRNDAVLELEVGRMAIEENNWPAVLALQEFGVSTSWLFEESLDYHRYDLAQKLLRSGSVNADTIAGSLTRGRLWFFHLPPFLEELIAAGADVNHQDESGDTPLHRAVEARSEQAIRLLLAKGADPTAANDDDRTPLKLARRLEEPRLAELLREGEEAWARRPRVAEPDIRPFELHGITFRGSGRTLTLDVIRAFEEKMKLTFTPEYRWLLLQANGGIPSAQLIPPDLMPKIEEVDDEEDEDESDDGDADELEVRVTFHPLRKADVMKRNEAGDEEDEAEMACRYPVEEALGWYHDGSEIPRGMVPIGSLDGFGLDGAGFLLLGCKGKDRGKLFAFDHGAARLNLTLPALFAKLAEAGRRPKSAGERLADAIAAKDLSAVKAVLAEGEKIPWTTRDGRIPIRMACEAKFDDAVVAMAEGGLEIGQLLSEAANAGRLNLIRRLFAVGDGPPKKAAADLLVYPVVYWATDILERIEGTGVNFAKRLRNEPYLLMAASESGSVDGLQFLFARGIDPHAHDRDRGTTLLHQAARADSQAAATTAVTFLLGLGVKPNQTASDGHTALHEAAGAGNLDAAKLLIDAGEDLHAKHAIYPEGMSPEQAAKMAQRAAKVAGKGFAELKQLMDDDDGPAMPDTSEPAGEKAAELMESMQKAQGAMGGLMAGLEGKLAAMARGDWGTGPSAAEWARKTPKGQTIIAQLEAYAAAQKR
jgi:ankyrin repeat protein